jgi:hypothetical protein
MAARVDIECPYSLSRGGPLMDTLKTIVENTGLSSLATFAKDFTPAEHFVAVTATLGMATFYLLEGEDGDMDAPIVGRLESPDGRPNTAFKGNSLTGGTCIASCLSFADAMARIVANQTDLT